MFLLFIQEVLQQHVLKRMEGVAVLPHHGRQPIAADGLARHQFR